MRLGLFILICFAFLAGSPAWTAPPPTSERKIVFIVLDGVRQLELLGKAKDDEGKLVPVQSLFPNLMKLKPRSLYLPNMRISNPVGISYPAYADMFAGHRQEKILSNPTEGHEFRSDYPTIFEVLKKELRWSSDQLALISSWKPLCALGSRADSGSALDFYKNCGPQEDSVKGAPYPGVRTDADTFLKFASELPKRHPRFSFIHLGGADSEGHFHKTVFEKSGQYYGIFHYHQALQLEDYLVARIWKLLQADPFYKDQTYLIISTDHGRDNLPDPEQWADHGKCVNYTPDKKLCSACPKVFGMILGPGVRPATVGKQYTHLDFAPTIAALLGAKMPEGTQGHLISEALPR